jgi:phosphoglucomutase
VLANGTVISARPSGTEPKIKFYFSVQEQLKEAGQFEAVKSQLQQRIKNCIEALQL